MNSAFELRVIWTNDLLDIQKRVRLGMHVKVEIIGVDPMTCSPDNP